MAAKRAKKALVVTARVVTARVSKRAHPPRSSRQEQRPAAKTVKQAKLVTARVSKRAHPPRSSRQEQRPATTHDLDTVSWWDDFYRVVRRIPEGRVTTYGMVAALGGHPRAARHVGYAMAALKETGRNADVPWQRVMGAAPREKARVTIKDPVGGALQRALLEAEGVVFDALGRVALGEYGWAGETVRKAKEKAPVRGAKRATPTRD